MVPDRERNPSSRGVVLESLLSSNIDSITKLDLSKNKSWFEDVRGRRKLVFESLLSSNIDSITKLDLSNKKAWFDDPFRFPSNCEEDTGQPNIDLLA